MNFGSTLILSIVVLFVSSATSSDFMLYGPSNTGTGAIMSRMGLSYDVVNEDQWNSFTVGDFRRYRAIVFGDPTCVVGSAGRLPLSNLNNLYTAVDGNVLVIGTDEIYHSGRGDPLVISGLNFVASTPGKVGLYVSLSCYYDSCLPNTPVPFLDPLSSHGKSFKVSGVNCHNDAHIVATSPAINGLTDGQLSGWSCSVHEAFSEFPPEFIPLVIANNVIGTVEYGLTFADGSAGIPYIMVRGDTVSPINCGDGVVSSPEECDGGAGCTEKCVCGDGYTPAGRTDCNSVDFCADPGYSGRPDHAISCVPSPGARTITCAPGWFPSAHSEGGDSPSVTLPGRAEFGGCFLRNPCTAFGFSGRPDYTERCDPGVDVRTIYCLPGYHAEGAPGATDRSVTLAGAAPFMGCTLIDTCAVYGYSGRPDHAISCISGVNTRTITCEDGYAASPPSSHSATFTGSDPFGGCTVIDMCATYGYGGDPHVISCTNGINSRTITCGAGYWADADSRYGVDNHSKQLAGNIPFYTIVGPLAFLGCKPICGNGKLDSEAPWNEQCDDSGAFCAGCKCNVGYFPVGSVDCSLIDTCATYGTGGDPYVEKCVGGVDVRTITCLPGYYAKSFDAAEDADHEAKVIRSITIRGSAPFAGCGLIDTCKHYGYNTGSPDPKVIKCESGINTRKITCDAGWYATSATDNAAQLAGNKPSVDVPGSDRFQGCKPICGNGKVDADNKEECDAGTECNPSCKCNIGYEPMAPLTISCALTDNCKKYGWGEDPFFLKCDNGVNIRTITCKPGYYASSSDAATEAAQLAGAIPSITLTGSAPFAGCKLIDNCKQYGWNKGATDPKVVKCENGINKRTITCDAGWYATSATDNAPQLAGNLPSVEVIGSAPFNGCKPICGNGKVDADNKEACDAGFQCVDCKCNLGYEAASPLSIDCALTDNCKKYGWGEDPFFLKCDNGVNIRTLTCMPGYYASSSDPTIEAAQLASVIPSITLTGDAVFAGCKLIDNCKQYGYNIGAVDPKVVKCENGVNKRTITCDTGYWATSADDNSTQYLEANESVVVIGAAKFMGCLPICGNGKVDPKKGEECDAGTECTACKCNVGYESYSPISIACNLTDNCAESGWGDDPFFLKCDNGINIRTITCLPGYYAQSSDAAINETQHDGAIPSITLVGTAPFAGCKLIDNCDQYGWGGDVHVILCENGINNRNITCEAGYYAQQAVDNTSNWLHGIPETNIVGDGEFLGCAEIDNCRLYGWSEDPEVESCENGINIRTITCTLGWVVRATDNAKNITLTGSASFVGCVPQCGDGMVVGDEGCDDSNVAVGDGCSAVCQVEDGFDCGGVDNIGLLCCKDLDQSLVDYGLGDKLKCYNSFWISSVPGSTAINFDNSDREFIMNSDLKLCGRIVLGGARKSGTDITSVDRPKTMIVNGPAVLYGTVQIMGGGALYFDPLPALDSSLTIYPNCKTDNTTHDGQAVQFQMDVGSGMAISNVSWTQEEEIAAGAFVRLTKGCAILDGDFWFQASDIPTKSNVFPLISTYEKDDITCVDQPFDLFTFQLPGSSCSNLELKITNLQEQNARVWGNVTMFGITNYKHLCNWQIGLIAASVAVAAAAAAAAAALLSGVFSQVQTLDYVAL